MESLLNSPDMQQKIETAFTYLPQVAVPLMLVLAGYIVAKIVQAIVQAIERLPRNVHAAGSDEEVYSVHPPKPQFQTADRLTYWAIFLFFVSQALLAIGVPSVSQFVTDVYTYAPYALGATGIVGILFILLRLYIKSRPAATPPFKQYWHAP